MDSKLLALIAISLLNLMGTEDYKSWVINKSLVYIPPPL